MGSASDDSCLGAATVQVATSKHKRCRSIQQRQQFRLRESILRSMDLQAIIDGSDVESECPSEGTSNVDLEQLLREDDDSCEDRNDITITSFSTIETNANHFSPKFMVPKRTYTNPLRFDELYHDNDDENSVRSPRTGVEKKITNTGSHNPEDWAVLQQILGEEDDDDDAWVDTRLTVIKEPILVDDILKAINDDDDDDLQLSFASMPHPPSTPTRLQSKRQWPSPAADSQDTERIAGSRGYFDGDMSSISPTTNGTTNNLVDLPPELVLAAPKVQPGDFAPNVVEEAASEHALQYAIAYEKKLLRPGHREIVSPLMVKRRLKPKIELGTSMQRSESSATLQMPSNKRNDDQPRFGFSGVLEDKAMPNLSAQLLKNANDKKVGLPTAISINSKFIAVGTQRGFILVFDLFEVLRQKLGLGDAVQDGHWSAAQGGSVTSIDVSGNGEALIAGYASGILVLWDIIKGVVLKAMSDVHPSPISAARFLNEKDLKVVSVDSGGLVNKLTFTKNLLWSAYSMETACLLDGTAGQILAMNVLPPHPSTSKPQNTFVDKLILIALSSERSSFAVAVEPSINVLHRWARPTYDEVKPPHLDVPSDFTFLPCLSWGWSLVLGGGNVLTPILARAWGCKLQFLRASFPTVTTEYGADSFLWPAFGLHDEFDSPSPIVALEWLGPRSLAYLAVNNEFSVVDTVMMTMLERLNFSGLKLVYAEFALSRSAPKDFESDGKGNSGRVCTTFQNTLRASDNRLLLLCQEEVRSISILGAKRRISALEEDGEWLEALALALDHYENTVKSQEDRQRVQGKEDISKHPEFYSVTRTEDEEWIAKLLIRYFNLAVDNAPDTDRDASAFSSQSNGLPRLDLAQSHFQMLAGVCVEFCVIVRRLDLLFGPIFRRFLAVGQSSVFLDVLEPYVLNDKLNYIAPEAMAHFVEHCKATNGIAVVERCLLHMDVTIMDFDSIISLLRRNDMFSALIHVFTHGLDDFVRPLEILLERLFDLADEGYATHIRRADGVPQTQFEIFGYKAIVYLQHCFRGKSFPQDKDLQPDDKLRTIRPLLLRFLQRERHTQFSSESNSDVVGHRALIFPYTQVLLLVDAGAILDLISLALDAPDSEFAYTESGFESIGGWEVEVGAETGSARGSRDETNDHRKASNSPDRQQIISMLSTIILPDEKEKLSYELAGLDKSKRAVNAFLDFMARYLTRGVVRTNKTVMYLIISRISDRYRSSRSPEKKRVAQGEIIALLSALPRNAYDPDLALRMIEDAGIHRAALLLHQQGTAAWHEGGKGEERRSEHFKSAIDCYLDDLDPVFRTEVFEYVKNECSGGNTADDSDIKKLKDSLLSKLADLVNLDAVLSAQLVAELYIEQLDEVIGFLGSGDSVAQFMLLHAIIGGDLSHVDIVSGSVLNANLSMDHHQIYLSLMARHHPDMVYDYLSTHNTYRPEECLELCRQYDIADASAYLLERMGNVSSALQLILQTFESRMMAFKRTVRGFGPSVFSRSLSSRRFLQDVMAEDPAVSTQDLKQRKEVEGVKRILVVALDLCERNSGGKTGSSQQGSQLWFNVLDRLINAKGFLRVSKEDPVHSEVITKVLTDMLQLTLQRMVSGVPLPDLIRKVTTDNAGNRLGELREMILILLRTYGHEMEVLSSAVNAMKFDAQRMEAKSRTCKVSGAPVRTVMHQTLRGHGRMNLTFADTYSTSGSTLKIGERGDAFFGDGGRLWQSNTTKSGLASALDRLNARRIPEVEHEGNKIQRKPAASKVPMLSQAELTYYEGGLSNATMYGERLVGELGEAQSYGSLRWIQSS